MDADGPLPQMYHTSEWDGSGVPLLTNIVPSVVHEEKVSFDNVKTFVHGSIVNE